MKSKIACTTLLCDLHTYCTKLKVAAERKLNSATVADSFRLFRSIRYISDETRTHPSTPSSRSSSVADRNRLNAVTAARISRRIVGRLCDGRQIRGTAEASNHICHVSSRWIVDDLRPSGARRRGRVFGLY